MLEEQTRLEELLHAQKELVVYDFKLLKDEFKPTTNAVNTLAKVVTPERGNAFLNVASNGIIDFVLKKVILGRAGWAARLIVPALVKNYTSHFIAENKEKVKGKLFSWFNKKENNTDKVTPTVQAQGN